MTPARDPKQLLRAARLEHLGEQLGERPAERPGLGLAQNNQLVIANIDA